MERNEANKSMRQLLIQSQSASLGRPSCQSSQCFLLLFSPSISRVWKRSLRLSQVKANMHTLQLAIESYATDTGGESPPHLKDVFPYLPGGENKLNGRAGTMPSDTLLIEIFENPVEIRKLKPSEFYNRYVRPKATPGKIWVAACFWPPDHPTTYCVTGNDFGDPLPTGAANTLLLLSN